MKRMLLFIGVILFLVIVFWFVYDTGKSYEEDQDYFENATHLENKMAKANLITTEQIREFSDAVVFGDLERVKEMVKDNSEIVNIQDQYGFSALHNVMSEEQFEIVAFLIEHDADVNIRNEYGISPLHLAAYPRNAELLLNAGAVIDIIDHQGNTPLHIAASETDDAIELVEYLISRNAPKNSKNKAGKTPLENAISAGNQEISKALK